MRNILSKFYIIPFYIFILHIANSAHAFDSITLGMPVDCTLGEECWIARYVDVDPSPESARDYTCAAKAHEGHKGIDIAVRSLMEMQRGVDVLSVATGRVVRVRDGEDDSVKDDESLNAIIDAKKDCGNGVLIDHGPAGFPGLRTMYCHLKKDSIVVQAKDVLAAGDKIAQIGHSGFTEFPHLHFGMIWEGSIIDPFTGLNAGAGCGKMKHSLWDKALDMPYEPVSIYDSGFHSGVPDFEEVKAGQLDPQSLSPQSLALVLWAGFYGLAPQDRVFLSITDPMGETFIEREITHQERRARQFYYTGRKLKNRTLRVGEYVGIITVKREGVDDMVRREVIKVE